MTELEQLARQYVHENKLTLGETLALSLFVAQATKLLQRQEHAAEGCVIDYEKGWVLK